MKIILDTSVVLKWFVNEIGSETARGYLEDFIDGKHQFLFPALLFYELGNACKKNSIPVSEIGKIMELMLKFSLEVEDIGLKEFRKIYQNASDYNLSFYDATFVTLMQKHNCKLVTADKKLFSKLKDNFSLIKLLYPADRL